jgi:cysteine-rich repeat protein
MKRSLMCALVAMGAGCHGGGSNHPPSLDDLALTTLEDTALVVDDRVLDPFDPDRDQLTITLSAPAHGVVTGDGPWTYQPARDFAGVDHVVVTVSDGELTASATITITVAPVNDPPTAAADRFAAREDGVLTIAQHTLLANDRDIDSAVLSVATVGLPQSGSVAISGDEVLFTPAPGFTGLASFTYTLTDGELTAPTVVVVAVGGSNLAPVAGDDALTVDEDSALTIAEAALLGNDVDGDGDTLAVLDVFDAVNGSIERAGPAITFTPEPNAAGRGSFGYLVTDGAATGAATVTVSVIGINDAPVAVDDEQWTMEDLPLVMSASDLVAYDVDADGDVLTVVAVMNAVNGTVVMSGQTITFTPAPNFAGDAFFEYVVSDGTSTDVGMVVVHCGPVNDPPDARDDRVDILEDASVVVTTGFLLKNDFDAEGDPLRVTAVHSAVHGKVEMNGDEILYTPPANFNGATSFKYTVTDGKTSDIARCAVVIKAVNDAPVAVTDHLTTAEDVAVTTAASALLANDVDVEGSALSITSVRAVSGGAVARTGASITFTPSPDFAGIAAFEYVVSDGALSATAVVTVDVRAVNDAPVAVDDALPIQADGQVAISTAAVLANDSDVDGDALTVIGVGPATHGTVSLSGDTIAFAAAAGYEGVASFAYTISDGALQATATASLTVIDGNDPPVAVDDTLTVAEDGVLVVGADALTGNDRDDDGDPLTLVAVQAATNGSVQHSGGEIRFVPAPDFHGSAGFEYVVSDGATTGVGRVAVVVTPVNDAPVAGADAASTLEDTALALGAGDLLANDRDVDGDALALVAVGDAVGGAVALDGAVVTFTPAPDFVGSAGFSYTISDGSAVATGTVTVAVGTVNDAPVATGDQRTILEDAPAAFASHELLANDRDVDGDALTVIAVSDAVNGVVALAGDTVTFTPTTDHVGSASFSYTISDGALVATATVVITVMPVNDAPAAVADTASTAEDTALVLADAQLLGNDVDIDGDTLVVLAVQSAAHGTVVRTDAGIVFTPAPDYTGPAGFEYVVGDGTTSTIGQVTVSVTAVNDAPVAVADTASTAEDTAVELSATALLGNDSDVDGDVLTLVAVGDAAHGAVSRTGDTIVFTPAPDFFGIASFTYAVSDGSVEATAVVTIEVAPVNDPPTADGFTATTAEDTAVTIAVGDLIGLGSDVDGDALSLVSVEGAVDGSVSLAGGVITFTPAPDHHGLASFDYQLTDGEAFAVASVVVTVTPVNDAPVAVDDAVRTSEDAVLTLAVGDLLGNDRDVDGDPLTVAAVGDATGGTVVLGDAGIVFTPAADFHGAASFTYTISDGAASATATVALAIAAVNDAPVAAGDSAETAEDTAVTIDAAALLANDRDVDGDRLAVTAAGDAENGAVTLDGAIITFAPAADFHGTARFRYTVSDGELTATGEVAVTVTPVNDAPVAGDDEIAVAEDTTGRYPVAELLADDRDVDGDTLRVIAVDKATNGAVVLDGELVVFSPDRDFHGTAGFEYVVSDGELSAVAVVTVVVTPVNDAPIAADDSFAVLEDGALPLAAADLLGNDRDIDGDPLVVADVRDAQNGTARLDGGNVVFQPDANFHGIASFVYVASDGAASASALVTVTVSPVNDAPTPAPDAAQTSEDVALQIAVGDLLGNDTDIDSDALSVIAVQTPSTGSVVLAGGVVTFTPGADVNGAASFEYVVSDGTTTAISTVAVTIAPVNDAPAPVPDDLATPEDTALVIPTSAITGNDVDVDGDTLTVTAVRAPVNGTVGLTGTTITFTPSPNFSGAAHFEYVVSDGVLSAVALANVSVSAVNDAPVAVDDSRTGFEDAQIVITAASLLANDTDIEGNALSIVAVQAPLNGTVTLGNGNITFIGTANYSGPARFDYVVSDGNATDVGTVNLTIFAINDAPVPGPDSFTTAEDTALVVTITQLLANDTDVDGNPLSIIGVTSASNGTVVRSGNNVTFTPRANFAGQAGFDYVLFDGSTTANGRVTITVTPVNDAPIPVPDAVATAEDTQVAIPVVLLLANDTDVDSTLTLVAVRNPTHGTVVQTGGAIHFVPDANFNGIASFEYVVSDGQFEVAAQVTVTVTAVNDPPVVTAVAAVTVANLAVAVVLTGADPDGDALTFEVSSQPGHGTLLGVAPVLTYLPALGFTGTDTFTFRASDGSLSSAAATATITVNLGAAAVCGNRRVEADEACDDGNRVTGDGCDLNCTVTGCGNGEVGGFAATAVTFEWLGTSCEAAEIAFSVGDTVVHREELSKACGCDAGIASATIEDPEVLALLAGDTTLSVAVTGADGALAWAVATVEVGAGGREVVLFDEAGGGDAELRASDLCVAGYTGATAATAVSELVEECDDGNADDGDGCSAACLVEVVSEPAAD